MVVHADTCEPSEVIGHRDKKTKTYSGGLLQKTFAPEQLIIRHLDTADYALWDKCGHSLGIERKAGGDLTNSLNNKSRQANGNVRLLNQIVRLKKEYTYPALLLEGTQGYYPFTLAEAGPGGNWGLNGITGWNWLSMQMMIWSWEQDGYKIFWTPNMQATVELLRGLNNRAETGCVLKGLGVKKKK